MIQGSDGREQKDVTTSSSIKTASLGIWEFNNASKKSPHVSKTCLLVEEKVKMNRKSTPKSLFHSKFRVCVDLIGRTKSGSKTHLNFPIFSSRKHMT